MLKKIILYGCLSLFLLTMACGVFAWMTVRRIETEHRAAAPGASTPASDTGIVGFDPDPPELVAKAKKLVADLERHHVVARWTCVGNQAYVNELAWAQFDIDAKRGVARSLAVCCHAQKSGRYIAIKGFHSGRTLAKFSGDALEVE
jgi:hypothetical protein